MKLSKHIVKITFLLALFALPGALAQNETKSPTADPCYEVVLQIVAASNNPADKRPALTPELAGVVKKLKTVYAFSDYRLTTTFLQRTSNSIEYKSLLNDFNRPGESSMPVFSEWSLLSLRNLPDAQGRGLIQFERFRFGARVPIPAQTARDEYGKSLTAVNYESIGVTSFKFTLRENEPTVIGSLAGAGSDELMFLVLTVRKTE
jgi:hypothetical protein